MNKAVDNLRLSIEEVALVLSIHGSPDAAKLMLLASFGELSPDEEKGRLLAAGHSLMARGFLNLNSGKSELAPPMSELVSAMNTYQIALRMESKSTETDVTITFFIHGNQIIQQSVEQGVVYRFDQVQEQSTIIQKGVRFFNLTKGVNGINSEPLIPFRILEQAREESLEVSAIAAKLKNEGVPERLCNLLAEDIKNLRTRGAVLRIDNKENNLISDHGFLTLTGESRTWLFPISLLGEERMIRVVTGTPSRFGREIDQLLRMAD
ncbi:MAG: hypothetical protein BroJett039_06900 [Chloroflexota bacterium]|nr:MAG: hypothetical protein BroJett039_06900 [Chloroflexota bacterium]